MDWTAGYASDIEYVAGFYREQSPSWLNFVCLLYGGEPVALDKPYTYFELGFGRGLTSKVLAATNPMGQFYAADFNPAHVAGARQLAADAQLDNLTLLENSFEELAAGGAELPQFDFITLHGIYTWVTAENRRHIVNFISRYLKPGGLVYVSYNSMPGWAAALPLQRLLVEYADAFPNRSDLQIKGAAQFVGQLEAAGATYLTQNPILKVRTDSLKTAKPQYLVHEYLHKHWQPLFHADVARDLADAKMNFAGSADLAFAYPQFYLPEEKRKIIETIANPEMRETLKDYFLNTAFRKDVFVRGQRHIGRMRQNELLRRVGVVLTVPRAKAKAKMKLTFGEVEGRADLYEAVFDALAVQPRTLAELAQLPLLGGSVETALQMAAMLCASSQTEFFFVQDTESASNAALRMNRTLAGQVRYGDDYQALCSPLLRSGIGVNYIERVFYLAMLEQSVEKTAAALAGFAWQVMKPSGQRMQRNAVALETDEENVAELTAKASEFLAERVPVWQQLKIL